MKRTLINLLVVCFVFSHFTISLRIGAFTENSLKLDELANIKGKSEVVSKSEITATSDAKAKVLLVLQGSSKSNAKMALESQIKNKIKTKANSHLINNSIASIEKNLD